MEQPSPYYPPVGFYFQLKIMGSPESGAASFQEVSGLQAEMSTESISEGGENRFKYRLPSAVKFQNLVLKRGVLDRDSNLSKWVNATLNGGLSNPIETKTIQVSLLGSDGKTMRVWTFHNAYPVKWEIAQVNSVDNSFVAESLEFAYAYFEVVESANT